MEQLIGLGGAGSLIIVGGTLVWRYIRVILNAQDARIRRLDKENRYCNWRQDILMGVVRQAGVPIPQELWGPAPWDKIEEHEREQREEQTP